MADLADLNAGSPTTSSVADRISFALLPIYVLPGRLVSVQQPHRPSDLQEIQSRYVAAWNFWFTQPAVCMAFQAYYRPPTQLAGRAPARLRTCAPANRALRALAPLRPLRQLLRRRHDGVKDRTCLNCRRASGRADLGRPLCALREWHPLRLHVVLLLAGLRLSVQPQREHLRLGRRNRAFHIEQHRRQQWLRPANKRCMFV